MKPGVLAFAFVATMACYGCSHINAGTKAASSTNARTADKPSPGSTTASAKVGFSTQIKPILEARCQPCHFSGGKVYDKMPFDRPETIKTLGTKMFTRIKAENEQHLIRDFLAQD